MKELGALAYRDTTAENREYWKSELAVAIRDLQAEYETKVDMIKSELETNYTSKVKLYMELPSCNSYTPCLVRQRVFSVGIRNVNVN